MSSEDQVMYEKGYADGAGARRLNKRPSPSQLVGMDEYCHGFRAAFFDRASAPESAPIARANSRQAS
jgi:hypothetical protein